MNRKNIVLFFAVVFFCSCSNKIDLLDNWKETMVVYGLLNQSDSIQYIQINKAYLGQGNALQMAQAYDSINYSNQLSVKMEQWLNGNMVASYTLQRDSSISKDPGVFSYPKQVLYATNAVLDATGASEYDLTITNTKTGKVVKGKTNLVQSVSFIYPSPNQPISLTNLVSPIRVRWPAANNGKLYQLTVRFHYSEKNKSTGVTVAKYVDWLFSEEEVTDFTSGGEADFYGTDFYKFLRGCGQFSTSGEYIYYAGNLDFMLAIAAPDFATYMEVYQPSTSIVQEKPEFTNIQNGIGLFSARLNISALNCPLTSFSLDSLYAGQYTAGLGFCSSNTTSPYYCH